MKKIILVGLINDSNIGDKVIYDNTKYLVEKSLKEMQISDYIIESMDMTGTTTNKKSKDNPKLKSKIKSMLNKIISPKMRNNLRYFLMKTKKENDEPRIEYYEKHLKGADLVIFVGGGIIKYLYQDFYQYISLIIKVCNKYNINVILNSVGIEGYSQKDDRCQKLKKALNQDCVKMITTRDDIKLLKNHYIENKNIILAKVADPAVWTYETYAQNKSEQTDVIGIGIIRPGIFRDNEIAFNEKKQLKLWSNIIRELEKKGYHWELFTNGLEEDYHFGKKILEYSGITDEGKMVDIPKNGQELVNDISKYRGVIAARMHANIISYSLDIPSVGIVWNDKLKMFGENIKHPERFITKENFHANYIVEMLEKALKEGYDIEKKEYEQTVYQALKNGIEISLRRNGEYQ